MKNDPTKKHTQSENQGEGDRKSAERFNQASQEFVKSGKMDEAVKRASGQDPEEAKQSEREGRKHAKEVDPAVHRDYQKPSK